MKSSEFCIKARSTPASLPIQDQVTKHTTVKWSIGLIAFGKLGSPVLETLVAIVVVAAAAVVVSSEAKQSVCCVNMENNNSPISKASKFPQPIARRSRFAH